MSYPTTFGKYLLLERINVGGMAEVFKAKAFGVEGFERILAIKRILPNMADDDEFINMFIDEARIAVQLSHANVVQIYELGKFENQYYIAMEYVAGKDLRQILDRYRKKKETMSVAAAAFITSRICDGLDYAHRKLDATGKPLNLIHRDVSPQNILVSFEGSVKITDFGIVKAEDRGSKTQAGVLKGKFGYMSPEQVRGWEIDNRSDIFAVGILLYEMVTGKRLFIGESDFSTLERVRNADVTPPTQHNPNIPETLERVMLKALARERDERYSHAADLADDLQQFLIEENSIFSGKRLAGLLQEEYREDIAHEMQKMEEFMRVAAPPAAAEAMSAAQNAKVVPPNGDWQVDVRSEKTMIFESGFGGGSAESPTQVAPGAAPESSDVKTGPGRRTTAVDAMTDATPGAIPLPPSPRKRLGLILGGAALALLAVLAGLAVWWYNQPPAAVETLVVTSTPTDTVDLYMDGELIGQKTPLVRNKVPVGEHRILARAAGYAEKVYRFDLVAGGTAVEIKIELEPMRGAELEVTSDPAMASVRLGGLPQGITPLVLRNLDPSRPVVLEISKPGFAAQTLTITFAADERHKNTLVKLLPGDANSPAAAPTTATGTLPTADTDSGPAKLVVHSRPDHASVYLGGRCAGRRLSTLAGSIPNRPTR